MFSWFSAPAQLLLTTAIFTVQSRRLIRWKRPGSCTVSGRPRPQRFERDKDQAKYYRHRNFGTRDQTESSHYGCCRAGITCAKNSQAGKPARRIRQGCLSYVLTERQISLYSCHICVVDARCFAQPAPAFCVFYGQQMAARRTRSQNLPTCGDFEAFGHRFARFAACNGLRHKAGKLIRAGAVTNCLL